MTVRFRALEGRSAAELAALSVASSMADTAREAAALAQRALVGGILVRAYDTQPAWFLAPWMLIRADRLDEVAPAIQEALDHSRATGSQLGFATVVLAWPRRPTTAEATCWTPRLTPAAPTQSRRRAARSGSG